MGSIYIFFWEVFTYFSIRSSIEISDIIFDVFLVAAMQTSHRFSILGCVVNPEALERGVSKQVIWTSFTFVDERNLETKIYTIFKISSKKCWSRNFERSIFIIQDCRLSFQILRVLEYVYVFSCSINLCFSQFVFSPNCTLL